MELNPIEKRRDAYLRRIYNISLSEYLLILDDQGFKCCLCLKDLEGISNPVDHDHKSGVVRGILCPYCNHRVLGRMTDWQVAQRMADYLREPPAVYALGERKVPKKATRKRKPTKISKSSRKTTLSTLSLS